MNSSWSQLALLGQVKVNGVRVEPEAAWRVHVLSRIRASALCIYADILIQDVSYQPASQPASQRQTARQTASQRQTDRQTDRQRQTETDRDRQTDTFDHIMYVCMYVCG